MPGDGRCCCCGRHWGADCAGCCCCCCCQRTRSSSGACWGPKPPRSPCAPLPWSPIRPARCVAPTPDPCVGPGTDLAPPPILPGCLVPRGAAASAAGLPAPCPAAAPLCRRCTLAPALLGPEAAAWRLAADCGVAPAPSDCRFRLPAAACAFAAGCFGACLQQWSHKRVVCLINVCNERCCISHVCCSQVIWHPHSTMECPHNTFAPRFTTAHPCKHCFLGLAHS